MNKRPRRSALSRPALALAALALAAAALAGTGQWTSAGPAGSVVYFFATRPRRPRRSLRSAPMACSVAMTADRAGSRSILTIRICLR